MPRICSALLLIFFFTHVFGQDDSKIARLPFCGWKFSTRKKIKRVFGEQFTFLSPQQGDTIVDIGAASGTYEGCLAAAFDLTGVDFILVDVDGRCLNEQKVENMRRYYSSVKGDSIRNAFHIVINTQDSLYLAARSYKKVWLLNTLHEVGSAEKMARDVNGVLRNGGEVCVLEIIPEHEGQLHGGCNRPLIMPQQIKTFFTTNGFRAADTKTFYRKEKATMMLQRFIKE